jgi:hypothetical protein
MNREEILRQLDFAVLLAMVSINSGDSVSLLYADLKIAECHKLLGWTK